MTTRETWRASRLAVAALACFAALSCAFGEPRTEESLPRAAVPDAGISPDVVAQGSAVHLVFGRKGGDIFYARSDDAGKTFLAPARMNGDSSRALVGRERGPKLALGRDGVLHVFWMGLSSEHAAYYSRSTDGGRTFAPARNLATDNRGVDGAAIAADSAGRVYVAWLGGGEVAGGTASSKIQFAFSTDNGGTFSAPQAVHSNYDGGACACCALALAAGEKGEVFLGVRGAKGNIRDVYVLRGVAPYAQFQAARVSDDRWRYEGCPMQGPSLQVEPAANRVLIAWTSREAVYRSASEDAARTFVPRIAPAAASHTVRRDPLAVTNRSGEILFVWVEGNEIHWERVAADGKRLAAGRNPGLPSGSRPRAFAEAGGQFVLVY